MDWAWRSDGTGSPRRGAARRGAQQAAARRATAEQPQSAKRHADGKLAEPARPNGGVLAEIPMGRAPRNRSMENGAGPLGASAGAGARDATPQLASTSRTDEQDVDTGLANELNRMHIRKRQRTREAAEARQLTLYEPRPANPWAVSTSAGGPAGASTSTSVAATSADHGPGEAPHAGEKRPHEDLYASVPSTVREQIVRRRITERDALGALLTDASAAAALAGAPPGMCVPRGVSSHGRDIVLRDDMQQAVERSLRKNGFIEREGARESRAETEQAGAGGASAAESDDEMGEA